MEEVSGVNIQSGSVWLSILFAFPALQLGMNKKHIIGVMLPGLCGTSLPRALGRRELCQGLVGTGSLYFPAIDNPSSPLLAPTGSAGPQAGYR